MQQQNNNATTKQQRNNKTTTQQQNNNATTKQQRNNKTTTQQQNNNKTMMRMEMTTKWRGWYEHSSPTTFKLFCLNPSTSHLDDHHSHNPLSNAINNHVPPEVPPKPALYEKKPMPLLPHRNAKVQPPSLPQVIQDKTGSL
jgi:hypothetical protein